jgi:integrase
MLHIKGADGTINRMINLVKAIFNLAKKNGHIETVIHLEKKKSPEGRIRWLTKEEWERLHEQLPPHLKAMATFAISTGLRQANVLGLEWNQVDMKRNVAWIHPDQAKQKKPIGIPLSKTAMDVLRGEEGKHETFVFTYEGVPVGSVKTAWGKALKRAGLGTWEKKGKVKVFKPNFKWHDLRHTWATWHVQSGTPLEVLQKLGGWSDFKMVLRYAHFAPEYLAGYADNSVPYARQIARAS